ELARSLLEPGLEAAVQLFDLALAAADLERDRRLVRERLEQRARVAGEQPRFAPVVEVERAERAAVAPGRAQRHRDAARRAQIEEALASPQAIVGGGVVARPRSSGLEHALHERVAHVDRRALEIPLLEVPRHRDPEPRRGSQDDEAALGARELDRRVE